MSSAISWIFTIGGLLGLFGMIVHSLIFNDRNTTYFIFAGGFSIAYLLEYTLSIILNLYSYQNLPLVLFNIPLVIPAGWIVTFYGFKSLSEDFGVMYGNNSQINHVLFSGFLALLFGLGIEVLARNIEFWKFNFETIKIFGIPLIVPLAWGLSVINFNGGIEIYKKKQNYWLIILVGIHAANPIVGYGLTQLI